MYNEEKSDNITRFTLAHELGHIFLNHNDICKDTEDKEADCFARNVLCPIPIVRSVSAASIDDYTSLFNISSVMAENSIKWQKNDFYYIQDDLYTEISSKFALYESDYIYVATYFQSPIYGIG